MVDDFNVEITASVLTSTLTGSVVEMDFQSDQHLSCQGNNSTRIVSSNEKRPLRRQFALRDDGQTVDPSKRSHSEGSERDQVEEKTAGSWIPDKVIVALFASGAPAPAKTN